MRIIKLLPIITVVIVTAINGCSAPPETQLGYCDPLGILPAPECLKTPDAGTDAESDAGMDGSSFKEDPGLQPSVFPTCKAECVPEASGSNALDWPNESLIVWFGPKSELATKNCPGGLSYEKVRGFDNLIAPPAKCDACACKSDGSCNGLPTSIEVRNGKCYVSNVQTTPFDGPPNWDGSCTSVNAMAAGKICNGVPCAQALTTPPLPGPTNESCTKTNGYVGKARMARRGPCMPCKRPRGNMRDDAGTLRRHVAGWMASLYRAHGQI